MSNNTLPGPLRLGRLRQHLAETRAAQHIRWQAVLLATALPVGGAAGQRARGPAGA